MDGHPMTSPDIERRIGYVFRDKSLLVQALTHSTHAYENKRQRLADNERLEFIGDSILGLTVGIALFSGDAAMTEGEMTATRALVVCEQSLAKAARQIGLGDALLLGVGEERTGGRDKESNLSNAMEALFGAVYLDSGFENAQEFVLTRMGEILQDALRGDLFHDFKSRLIEKVQSHTPPGTVQFLLIEESGKEHERVFRTRVEIDGDGCGEGSGRSKKESEQVASRQALRWLDRLDCLDESK
jgi:ribonuclease-3